MHSYIRRTEAVADRHMKWVIIHADNETYSAGGRGLQHVDENVSATSWNVQTTYSSKHETETQSSVR